MKPKMLKINKEIIEKLNPCKDRFDNFKAQYPDFSGNLQEFLELENITYSDKVWVVTRLFTKEQNVLWSILCAESVLYLYEEKYPEDKRPREAIEAAKKWLKVKNDSAARAAAADAADAARAARAAARAAAADAARAARAAEKEQETKNLSFMLIVEREGVL